jgi:peptidoglycan/LPS O-acetylase OafA/YrhL
MVNEGKLPVIEYLRGIAALMVAWYHITLISPAGPVHYSGALGWAGVEVFFVISGFVLPASLWARHQRRYTASDLVAFAKRRIVRIEPPYLISVLLAFGLWHISAMVPGFRGPAAPTSLVQLFAHVAYLPPVLGYPWINGVYWTLAYEVCFYLLLGCTYAILVRKPVFTITALLSVTLLALFLIRGKLDPFVPLFAIGAGVFLHRYKLITLVQFLLVVVGAGTISALAEWSVATPGLIAAGLLYFCMNFRIGGWLHRVLLFAGAISYSLYITHGPTSQRIVNLGMRHVSTEVGRVTVSVLALLFAVGFATAFWYFIERRFVTLAKAGRLSRPKVAPSGEPA